MATINLVSGFDFARKLSPVWTEYFQLGQLKVDAITLEADAELEKAIKDEPLLAQQLRDAATQHVDAVAQIVKEAIDSQIKRIEETLKSDEPYQTLLRKLEDIKNTLNVSVRQATDSLSRGAQDAVQKALDEHARRKKLTRPHRAKIAVKASLSTLTIAVGVTSLILTAGANVVAYLAIANAVSKLGLQLKDGLKSADDAAAALERQINDLARDIDSAVSKTKTQSAKEAAAVVAPILTTKMSTINTAGAKAAELGAKLQACERTCTTLTAEALKGVEKLKQLEAAVRDQPKKKAQVEKLAQKNEESLRKVEELQPALAAQWAFQKSCLAQVEEWKAKRSAKVKLATRTAQGGTLGAAVYGLVSTGVQLAAAI